ncbi:hypothetical protein [Meiothermus granaticius]|uniref:Uncharacterized protein n=1 Tax=Meiothermus granaticius NBRC 107808 TaxID=1227551 RepID=A0A399F9V2_9DEIN|nr:hypothetical protein [Meiothermus granaticius]RIH91702.1 hypothetical protein Mgrana_02368 [Meiothermus granaticius NBRC 107808]
MRKGVLFLALLVLLGLGFRDLAYACTRPDCLPPGVVKPSGPGGPSGTGR